MNVLFETLYGAIGTPEPEEGIAMPFDGSNSTGRWWQDMLDEGDVKAGFFLNRFLYLFGEQLPKLQPCLKAWSFLLPKDKELYVIGKNAYGALLVVEDPNGQTPQTWAGVLDPTAVEYFREEDLAFGNLLGWWIPNKKVPRFLDTGLYEAWAATSTEPMEADEILGMTIPTPLGGKWAADNFIHQNIVDYYEGTASAIKKAVAGPSRGKPRKNR